MSEKPLFPNAPYPPHLDVHQWFGSGFVFIECLVCHRASGHRTQSRLVRARFLRTHRRCGFLGAERITWTAEVET